MGNLSADQQAQFDQLSQTMVVASFGGSFVFILILALIVFINRRDMTGWNMPIKAVWFTIAGRINRKTYWISGILSLMLLQTTYGLVVNGITFGITSIVPSMNQAVELIVTIIMLVTALPLFVLSMWASIGITFKRLHDRNRSGWFLLIGLIPVVGFIWLLVEIGFLRGKEGPNKFGPEQSDGPQSSNGDFSKAASTPQERNIEEQIYVEEPSTNLNDAPNSEIIAQRLGPDFLEPEAGDNSPGSDPQET